MGGTREWGYTPIGRQTVDGTCIGSVLAAEILWRNHRFTDDVFADILQARLRVGSEQIQDVVSIWRGISLPVAFLGKRGSVHLHNKVFVSRRRLRCISTTAGAKGDGRIHYRNMAGKQIFKLRRGIVGEKNVGMSQAADTVYLLLIKVRSPNMMALAVSSVAVGVLSPQKARAVRGAS